MDRVEKRLLERYNYWLSMMIVVDPIHEDISHVRWVAEYYRDGLAQYRLLHDPVMQFMTGDGLNGLRTRR